MSRKRRFTSGETLVETLVALLITTFAMLILPGAVVASAKVDAMVEKQTMVMNKEGATELSQADGFSITVKDTTEAVDKTITYPKNDIRVFRYGEEAGGLYRYEIRD